MPLGTNNIHEEEQNKAKELADVLANIYLNGKKDGMTKLIANTLEVIESKSSKEDKRAFLKFKKFFEKAKKGKGSHNDNKKHR